MTHWYDELKIGLKRGTVKLRPYTNSWKLLYKKEANILELALKNCIDIIDIQHIGSTSIPKLKSKPIIDIAIGIKSLKDGKKCVKPLKKLGYEYKHGAGIKGRHFFAKGPEKNRTHYLHIEKHNGKLWQNHILFRDYLKKFSKIRKEYQKIKEVAALKYKNDREKYSKEKENFIKNIIKKSTKKPRISRGFYI